MKTWKFKNVVVEEEEYNHDLHCFKVSDLQGNTLGYIYPEDCFMMESCMESLDCGEDPISGGWEDGCGNSCTMDGWGYYSKVEHTM